MAIFTFKQLLDKHGVTADQVSSVTNTIQNTTNSPQTFLQDAGSDIKQIGTDISNSLAERGKKFDASTNLYQKFGQGAGLASDVIGSVIKGGVKTVLPQSAEDTIKKGIISISQPIVNSDLVRGIVDKYNSLDENTKRNLDATLGIGSLAADLAGGGITKNGIEDGINTGLKTATKVGENLVPVINKTGSVLKNLGESSTGLAVNMETPTKLALQAYQANQPSLIGRIKNFITDSPSIGTKPITEANTAVRLVQPGTEWQIGVNAKKASDALWNDVIKPSLRSSENVNDMKTFLNNIKNKIIIGTKDLDRRNVLLEAWQSFADDYKKVRTFSDSKLQEYKEGWSRFVPEKSYNGKPIGAASKEIRALAADEARKTLYNILPNGKAKQAYIDYGNLKSIADAGIKSVEGLTDKSFSRKIYESIIDKAVTPVATIAGKILYRTGEGLEFIGNKGAKKVKDIIKK